MTDLCIKHNSTEDLSVVHGNLETVQGFLVILMSAMGEIEAGNIHPCSQKLLQHGH